MEKEEFHKQITRTNRFSELVKEQSLLSDLQRWMGLYPKQPPLRFTNEMAAQVTREGNSHWKLLEALLAESNAQSIIHAVVLSLIARRLQSIAEELSKL